MQYIKFKLCSLRFIAEREVEEAKRQEAAAAEKTFDSKSADFELEEPVAQLVPPPKEEAPVVAAPVVTKLPAGKKRKKKQVF